MEILAKRLLELRKGKKLSRKEVASATGIAERTYQRYENAEREPDASVLLTLANYFDVSADYLLGRTDDQDKDQVGRSNQLHACCEHIIHAHDGHVKSHEVIFVIKFPERLKEARISKGLKQREVASFLGIRPRSYQSYEGGDREPDFKSLVMLADYLEVSTDYLLGRTDNREVNR